MTVVPLTAHYSVSSVASYCMRFDAGVGRLIFTRLQGQDKGKVGRYTAGFTSRGDTVAQYHQNRYHLSQI